MATRVNIKIGRFTRKLKAEATSNLQKAGAFAERKLKQKVSGDRSGRIYADPAPGVDAYQASSPGEPPAVRTGNLKASIEHRTTADGSVLVGSGVEYAAALELGTERMAPRPWLRTTIRQNSDKIATIIAKG